MKNCLYFRTKHYRLPILLLLYYASKGLDKHCLVTKHFTVRTPCLMLFDRVWSCLIKIEGHQTFDQKLQTFLLFSCLMSDVLFVWTAAQPRPQGSLLSCAGRIGTPGQSDFKADSYWLLKQRHNNRKLHNTTQHNMAVSAVWGLPVILRSVTGSP